MRPFAYERPRRLGAAIRLLGAGGPAARLLAGGTDLIIRLRDGTTRADVVVDVKGIAELDDAIHVEGDRLVVGARAVMTDVAVDARIRRDFLALAEAAAVVGSAQIRNRATLAGNICNASPAADTVPALLVFDATVVVTGPAGERRIPIDEVFVRSGVTTIAGDEIVTAVELPLPAGPRGSVHLRRTRRRGHDLASVTLACTADEGGVRLAYGSLGPRPVLAPGDARQLVDPGVEAGDREAALDRLLADARPSPTSMRAGPSYRLAMLRTLSQRGAEVAHARLVRGGEA